MVSRAVRVRYSEYGLTVDDEDVEVARRRAGNTNEVDVVLRESHHGLVGVIEASRLDVVPGGTVLGSSLVTHVQGE